MFSGKEITVSKKAFSRYKTITDAIKSAVPGTKIIVEPGIYHENIIINKEIELVGNGLVNEIIVYSKNKSTILMQTECATVSGLTIQQRGTSAVNESHYAIDLPVGSLTIDNCDISSEIGHGIRIAQVNTSPVIQWCNIHDVQGVGIFIASGGNPTIRSCKIYNNKENGVWMIEKARGTIENCEIYSNTLSNVMIEKEADPVIKGCKIFNSEQDGVWVKEKGRGTIENCEFHHNEYPNVSIESEADPVIRGCKIYNSNQFGVWINERGRGTIENCEIHSNNFSNINIVSEADPVVKNCAIYNSILDAGIKVEKNGHGTIENCEVYSNKTSNVMLLHHSDPVIRGCKIYNSEHRGVWVDHQSRGIIENCEIYLNGWSNVLIENRADPVIRGCKIYNAEKAGIMVLGTGRGSIENCEIYSNKSSNVVIKNESDTVIRDCKIYNSENGGVLLKKNVHSILENCEIYGNKFSNIIIVDESDPVIRGCKIYNSGQNGVWVKEKGRGTIENCEIYSNKFPNITIKDGSDLKIKGCKIYNSEKNGVFVKEKGLGHIENCEIYGNAKKDILISEDSHLEILGSTKKLVEEKEQLNKAKQDDFLQPSLELADILVELDSLIGMDNIKEEIRKIIKYIQFNKELASFGIESENAQVTASHTVLYGNPGTGKTTVAKLLGKLYKAMGLLPSGHVVQVNREKLVGKHIGHTAPKTKSKIDEAQGGVLFIDEAYYLTNSGSKNDFGPEAIGVILEEMENRKGEFVVIVAGYEKEMMSFLEANPGLKSRFTQNIHLQDYTPDEMLQIARKMVKDKKRELSPDAEELLHKQFTALWRKRDQFFSNARTVRNHIEGMLPAQAQRCMQVPREQWTKEFLLTLTAEDVQAVLPNEEIKTFDLPINEELLSEALQQLHRMIGMDQVKAEIEKLATLVRFYKEEGRNLADLSTHTLLIGSPGTGKTEIARIIAKIYQALGILERGSLIEVKRDDLVSAYSGESEKKIAHYINQAMGGTLFIDEAYQLTQYGTQDPGHKVIEVLLKRMEDDRGKFIVIAAGYKGKMEQFLDSNDGLRRRFVQRIEFDDYTPAELMQISELILQEKGYKLSTEAYESLGAHYTYMYENRDHTFGNAGFARNIVNEAIKNLDYRIARISKEERNVENIKTILEKDIKQ